MARSRGKGGKKRKKGKAQQWNQKRELLFAEEDQLYGQVTKMLGNSRVMAMCTDKEERVCLIRGKMKNRVWINVGDVVLISIRDIEPDKGDIIHKYNPDEVRGLKKHGEVPEIMEVTEQEEAEAGGDIVFEDEAPPQDARRTGLHESSSSDEEEEEKKEEEADIDAL